MCVGTSSRAVVKARLVAREFGIGAFIGALSAPTPGLPASRVPVDAHASSPADKSLAVMDVSFAFIYGRIPRLIYVRLQFRSLVRL